ncbi:ABC transporter permease [Cytophagales bacterium LB-30]|uniref:ABC transporter permease n=1 Tax=Shiella aurantiaca TaxID=3058365 RepID=A0ABT8F3T5_9BACT|nr:FtsX-like permease family protein [Shiella aurantiaca]MDN4164661.1 ABC transporter permease [Shiella aurantiaca]
MLTFEIAKTHLLSKPKQTLVAMMGVTFGIGMFIAMVSLMTGLNNFTEELTMTSTPDIRIFNDITRERLSLAEEWNPEGINQVHHQKPKNETAKLRNAFQIASDIRTNPMVLGAAPQLSSQVFYNYGPVQLNGMIAGVDIMEEDKLFDLRAKIKSGRLEDLLSTPDGLIMGSGLARKLNVQVGDRVVITTPQGFTMSLRIVGVFQMGLGAIDNIKSYANISTVQNIMQKDRSYITEINIKLKDTHQAKPLAQEMEKVYGYRAEDWETANATMLTGVVVRNIMTYSVSITLLIVAGFGIYNILNMTIYNKMKDIAILKATGFASNDVREIFLIQSLVIGFLGSLLGLMVGFGLSYLISLAPFDGGEFISITQLPVNFSPTYYIIGIIFGVSTTAIAGYMPARKAGKIDPIEILRGV